MEVEVESCHQHLSSASVLNRLVEMYVEYIMYERYVEYMMCDIYVTRDVMYM